MPVLRLHQRPVEMPSLLPQYPVLFALPRLQVSFLSISVEGDYPMVAALGPVQTSLGPVLEGRRPGGAILPYPRLPRTSVA